MDAAERADWSYGRGAGGFRKTFAAFEKRIDTEAEQKPPVAASAYLESGNRWNPMMHAIFSYISGATLECIDARDYARYEDTGKNWRVREGYGALFAALGAGLPVDAGDTGERDRERRERSIADIPWH